VTETKMKRADGACTYTFRSNFEPRETHTLTLTGSASSDD
jgi:hypothetical protein